MHRFLSILTCLAVILQVMTPVVACGWCVDCACATTGSCEDLAEQKLGDHSSESCCCGSASPGGESQSCEGKATDDSLGHKGHAPCQCHLQNQPEAIPGSMLNLNLLLTVLVGYAPAFIADVSPDELPLASYPGSETDDRTRPHRVARCHLLDCVWLI